MDDDQTRHVPLEERHRENGARMTPFNGFLMPVQYEGIKAEHHAVRDNVGLFDVSHMGEIEITGPEAIEVTNQLITNDASTLVDGQAQYSAMCNEEGGIVDDLVLYRLGAQRVLVVVNAGNRQKDYEHMVAHADGEAEITNTSDDWVQLALQGPNAEAMLQGMVDADLQAIKFYRSAQTAVAGIDALVSRTGYTGEDGFELYVDASDGVELFDALVEEGEDWELSLCGLGARDTLRLEAMLNLYGQDMDESTNPYEARLGWVVKLDKDTPFVGQDALAAIKERGPDRRLRGLVLEGRGVIRPGYTIQIDGTEVGQVTSGSFAPTLEQSIGLGYIDAEFSDASEVDIVIRGREVSASVTREPFYKADA